MTLRNGMTNEGFDYLCKLINLNKIIMVIITSQGLDDIDFS